MTALRFQTGGATDITGLPSGALTSKETMMDAGNKQTTIPSYQECLPHRRSRSTMVQFGGPMKQGNPTHPQPNGTGPNLNAAFFNNSVTKREFVYSKMHLQIPGITQRDPVPQECDTQNTHPITHAKTCKMHQYCCGKWGLDWSSLVSILLIYSPPPGRAIMLR